MTLNQTPVTVGYEVVFTDGYTVLVLGADIPFDAVEAANAATGRTATNVSVDLIVVPTLTRLPGVEAVRYDTGWFDQVVNLTDSTVY